MLKKLTAISAYSGLMTDKIGRIKRSTPNRQTILKSQNRLNYVQEALGDSV